ncbi:MAG: M1 family aminopeptidase [Candidatus Eiseniibacteriota bacterium]
MMRNPGRRRLCALIALAVTIAGLHGDRAAAGSSGRLDREVLPTGQSVRLELDPSVPGFSGAVHIDLRVVAPTDSFRLYAKDMDVISVRLAGAAGPVEVTHASGDAGLLTVRAGQPIAAGDYGLDIDFMNEFDQRANSLYRVKSGEDWYCYTQFEAIAAREAFPCWDEPEFKIPFQLTVTVPEKCTAVSNTPVDKESTIGGQRTVAFKRTQPLPSYLVALAAGPFDYLPIRGMSVPGRVVTVKGSASLAREAAAVAPPVLAALEKYFGRPYPYEKLDLIAVPEFAAGAMENAGAITFRDEILLVDPGKASVRQRQRLASITAHEMAHMWFGDLVTMDWWDDLWLNESFASWMGDRITHQVFPQYNTPVRELTGTQFAMNTDAGLTTRAIRQAVDAFANIDRLFDELSYQKGQAVLGMLESWLDPQVFRRGVIAYLEEHAGKNATAFDLWRALSAAAGRDVTPATLSFLDQGGVPLVSSEVQSDGTVRLRQRRFLNHGVQAPPAAWKIPVTLRYSDGRQIHTQNVMLEDAEQTVKLDKTSAPAWVHPNAGERGYYRWFTPLPMLETLAASGPKVLDARERVGFMNNLSALFDAGLIGGDDYLRTLERFADDPAPEVVTSLVNRLERVHEVFITPDLAGPFTSTVRRMLRPSIKRFGIEKSRGEPEAVSLMRPVLLAALGVRGNDPEILEWGRAAARRYLDRPDSVDPSVAGAALNLAARDGDLALYESYRLRFESAKVPSERARFLAALGHFRRSDVMVRALDYVFIGPLRPQEILTIPINVAEGDELKRRVWRWFTAHYDVIVKRIPPFYLPSLPGFGRGCDQARIAEAREFFSAPAADLPGTQEELAKVIERNTDCVGLRERETPSVSTYLTRQARVRAKSAQTPNP